MGKISKFSTLLLTGKAASLPFLIQQANAYSLSYADVLSSQVGMIQLPAQNVRLQSLGTPPGQGTPYNGAATYCHVSQNPHMSVVITGLKNDDVVYLVTSTNLGGLENVDPRIKIGMQNLQVPVASVITAPEAGVVSVTLRLDMAELARQGYALTPGSRFYMQSLALPIDALQGPFIDWSRGRYSELDVITVGNMSYTAYGQSCY